MQIPILHLRHIGEKFRRSFRDLTPLLLVKNAKVDFVPDRRSSCTPRNLQVNEQRTEAYNISRHSRNTTLRSVSGQIMVCDYVTSRDVSHILFDFHSQFSRLC